MPKSISVAIYFSMTNDTMNGF